MWPTYLEEMVSVDWAAEVAERLLEPLGRRWRHVQAVAESARNVAGIFDERARRDALVAAAYLHDIGYAPELATTGFHPLDGARFVRKSGDLDTACLVAHHTGARNEALLRSLSDELEREFPYDDSLLQRALTYCDLTTGPDGAATDVDSRVAEIVERYGADHVVSRGILMGHPEFKRIEDEIESLLPVSGSPEPSRPGSR